MLDRISQKDWRAYQGCDGQGFLASGRTSHGVVLEFAGGGSAGAATDPNTTAADNASAAPVAHTIGIIIPAFIPLFMIDPVLFMVMSDAVLVVAVLAAYPWCCE